MLLNVPLLKRNEFLKETVENRFFKLLLCPNTLKIQFSFWGGPLWAVTLQLPPQWAPSMGIWPLLRGGWQRPEAPRLKSWWSSPCTGCLWRGTGSRLPLLVPLHCVRHRRTPRSCRCGNHQEALGRDVPQQFSGQDSVPPLQGWWIQSQAVEWRACMLYGQRTKTKPISNPCNQKISLNKPHLEK